jgi:DNA modification methylase
MKNSNLNQSGIQRIKLSDVIVPDITKAIYDHSNRESEINSLMESISEHGQLKPIDVNKEGSKYLNIDGVLRQMAMNRLNLNEIDAIVHEFVATDEFSLADLIIHHQIRKEKTVGEKLNEVRALLRIDDDNKNPLRDKEKRVTLISSMLGGKGWARNNVFSFENILHWEKKTNSEGRFSDNVMRNEMTVNKAVEAIRLIENPLFNKEKEEESHIIEGYVQGKYSAERAVGLMKSYNKKKKESHTVVKLHPVEKNNFSILKGNIEEIQLPDDLEADIIFTSSPYYKLIKYGDDPNELGWEKTPEEFVKRLCDILMKCYWKLKNTGSMFINLGETYEDSECLAITERVTVELIKRGARFVDRLIWNKVSNKPVPNNIKRLRPGYETILHFSKTRDYYFEKIKLQSDKKLQVTRGCREKNSDKVSFHIQNNYDQFRNVLADNEISTMLTVQLNKNRTKHIEGEEEHPATFSSNLPVIPLLIATPKNRDAVVFDPFMGSGSCGVTALLLGFKFVGVELYDKNIQTAERILSESQDAFDADSLNSLLEDYKPDEDSEELDEITPAA